MLGLSEGLREVALIRSIRTVGWVSSPFPLDISNSVRHLPAIIHSRFKKGITRMKLLSIVYTVNVVANHRGPLRLVALLPARQNLG